MRWFNDEVSFSFNSQTLRLWKKRATCGATGMILTIVGLHGFQSPITLRRIKIPLHNTLAQGIGMIQVSDLRLHEMWSFNFNQSDTLLLGNFGLSYEQSKAQLAVWAVLAAPFLLSNDLRAIQPEIKDLILNREVIAIDQDALGIQGHMLSRNRQIEIWARPVLPIIGNEYSYAVAFVSRRTDGHAYAIQIKLKDLRLSNKAGYRVTVRTWKIYHFASLHLMNFRICSIINVHLIISSKPTRLRNVSIQVAQTSTSSCRFDEIDCQEK